MQWRVLGPFEVVCSGRRVALGGTKQRAVLGLLVAAGGRVVPVSRLVDELWGQTPPAKVLTSVQSYVANLRRALEPDRPARAVDGLLETRPPGYALRLTGEVDAAAFERLTAAADDLLVAQPSRALTLLTEAGRLWRGDAYADLAAAAPTLASEAARLHELRLLATENTWRAELALGAGGSAVGEIEAQLAVHPLREQLWALLALALYRGQRQGDALEALRRARRVLADQLGVEPGPELRGIERGILAQEPLAATVAPPVTLRPASPPSFPGARGAEAIVGRDDQLSRLAGSLVDAAAGRGRVVLVTGEAGIGKTALARSLAATAVAMRLRVGWGAAQQYGGAPAMWPWTTALRGLVAAPHAVEVGNRLGRRAGALAPVLAEYADAAGTALPPDVDSGAFRLAAAVAALLEDVVGPGLLVLDDLQWADADTLHLLRRLAPELSRLPVVVLATMRDGEPVENPELTRTLAELARAGPERVRLGVLAPEDVAAYVRQRHGVEVPGETARALHERTGGNPFFLGELVRLLADDGRLMDPRAATSSDVPDGVRDVVRARLAQLPPGAAPLLDAAAVSGRGFDVDVVRSAAGLDDQATMAAVEAALASGLLVTDAGGRHRFSHELVRDAVTARLSPGRRRDLHGRLARAIESMPTAKTDDRLAELAAHHGSAGPGHARAAWTSAVRAAARAAAQPAPAETVRLLQLARAAVVRDSGADAEEHRDVLAALALALRRAGQDEQAWAVAREAVADALAVDDVVGAARAAVGVTADAIWSWRGYQVVDEEAIAMLERLIARLPDGHDVLRAGLLAALAAELYYSAGAAARGAELSAEAVRLARASGTPVELARVLELRHVALERPLLLAERFATADELLALAERAGDPVATARALVFRGRDLIESGEVARGLRDYDRARDLAEAHGVVPVLVALSWAGATILVAQGRFADAERGIAAATALHAGTTLPGATELPIVLTASLHLAQGTLPLVAPLLAEVAAATGFALLRDWHALALVQAGRIGDARAAVGSWAEQPEVAPDYMGLTHGAIRARLWAELAPPAAVRALADELTAVADRVAIGGTGVAFAGFAGHGLGLLARAVGDLDTAVTAFTDARDRNHRAGFAPFAQASAEELARTLALLGSPLSGPPAAGATPRAG